MLTRGGKIMKPEPILPHFSPISEDQRLRKTAIKLNVDVHVGYF